MLIVTFVFIAVLSLIYVLTRDMIELNETLDLHKAVLYAADIEVPETAKAVDELYRKRVREKADGQGDIQYFEVLDLGGQNTVSYAVITQGPGLWGEILAVVGVDKGLLTLTGIEFIQQTETPGLGARITEHWFKEQFRGKTGSFSTVPEGQPAGARQFQAITGASYTTAGVLEIVNSTLEDAPGIVGQ
jgi:Na+-transporting NADH:ubiquinone oxidoreductase subunit C